MNLLELRIEDASADSAALEATQRWSGRGVDVVSSGEHKGAVETLDAA